LNLHTQNTLPAVGQRFFFCKSEYEVAHSDHNYIRYASIKGGKPHIINPSKFEAMVDDERFEECEKPSASEQGIINASQVEIDVMNRRLKYVHEVMQYAEYKKSEKHVKPYVDLIGEELGETEDTLPKRPSASAVVKWVIKFMNEGQSNESLIPNYKDRGKRPDTSYDGKVEGFIDKAIREVYLTENRRTKGEAYELLEGMILENFAEDDEAETVPAYPSLRTFERRIEALDISLKKSKRFGKHFANKALKAAGIKLTSDHILQVVEADGNLLDILIVDPYTGEILGRPTLTAIIDRYTRVIIAVEITLEPFSQSTLMRTIKKSMNSEDGLKGGSYQKLVVDNGSDYISKSAKSLCNHLGITLSYCAPREPNGKAMIERFFGTLNTQLIHTLPGTTYSNPKHKGDYQSDKKAAVSLDELKEYVNEWLDLYHHNIHSGTERVPYQHWDENASEDSMTPVNQHSPAMLDQIARTVKTRTITKGRVRFANIKWYSNALATIEQTLRDKGVKREVEVYIDELDLSHVFVKDPLGGSEPIKANSIDPEYTNGLSMFEHKKISDELKEQGKKDLDAVKSDEWKIARWKLYQKVVKNGKEFAKRQVGRITKGNKAEYVAKQGVLLVDADTGEVLDGLEHVNAIPTEESVDMPAIQSLGLDLSNSNKYQHQTL